MPNRSLVQNAKVVKLDVAIQLIEVDLINCYHPRNFQATSALILQRLQLELFGIIIKPGLAY